MDNATADATVRFILSSNYHDRDVRVTFYGGEALLALAVVKSMVAQLYEALKERVEFAISTNGLLLDRSVVSWICSYPKFKVYVSIDSYRELHDSNRVTAAGADTFSRIIANLEQFSNDYHERYRQCVFFLVTLTSWDKLPEASQRWNDTPVLRHRPPMHLSFVMPRNIADVKAMIGSIGQRRIVLDMALSQYEAGHDNLLTSKFKEWTDTVSRDCQASMTDDTITVTTCVEDFYRTFISTEGSIYICERFAKQFIIGSVYGGIDSEAPEEIEASFIEFRNSRCRECEIAAICSKCMTILNHDGDTQMLDALCELERKTIGLIAEYAWKRRQVDRKRQLTKAINRLGNNPEPD